MRKINGLAASAVAGAIVAFIPAANAQTLTTFAQSTSIGTGQFNIGGAGPATPAKYISFDSGTNKLTVTSGINVSFSFQDLNNKTVYDPDGRTSIRALMTFTATAAPNSAVLSGSTITQQFTDISVTYTAVQPYVNSFGSFTKLLTVNFASGFLTGALGDSVDGGNPTFSSSSPAEVNGALAGYSSDFLNFAGVTSEQFSIAMSGAVNTGAGATGNALKINSNNQLQSFNADGLFIYSANPPPGALTPTPAPAGVVSGLIGIAMGGAQFGMMRFRRRRATRTKTTA